jgi:hypothetical protein
MDLQATQGHQPVMTTRHDPDTTFRSSLRHLGAYHNTGAEGCAVNLEKMQCLWREQVNRESSTAMVDQVQPRPLGAAARIRSLLPALRRSGYHGVPEPVFHDVPAAAASRTGSEAGVTRHRDTVEHPIRRRRDRA